MSESYVYRDVTLELRHVVGRDLQVDRGQEHEEEEVEKVASKASVTDATQEAGQQSALRTFPTLKLRFFERRLHVTVSAGTVLVYVHVLRVLHIRALSSCV